MVKICYVALHKYDIARAIFTWESCRNRGAAAAIGRLAFVLWTA
jgi:hypothetical protein